MAKKFGGFTPEQQQTLLSKLGYNGPAQQDDINKYMMASPKAASMMGRYSEMARKRVEGDATVGFAAGGLAQLEANAAAFAKTMRKGNSEEAVSQQQEYRSMLAEIAKLKAQAATPATTPAATTPVDTPPAATTPVDTTPVDTPPAATTPVDTTPVDTTPVDTPPVDTTPTEVNPTPPNDQDVVSEAQSNLDAAKQEEADAIDSLNQLTQQLSQLPADDPNRQNVEIAITEAQASLARARANKQTAVDIYEAGMPSTTELRDTALTSPEDLVTTAGVETFTDAEKAAGTIATGAGTAGTESQAGVTDAFAAADVVTPVTKDAATYDATTAQEGVQGALEGMTAAEGDVSKTVEAQQGELSDKAVADAIGMDEDYIQQVKAGTLQVTPEQLAKAALATNIPEAEIATFLGTTPEAVAATFAEPAPEAVAQDTYNLTPTEAATMQRTEVQDAAKAGDIVTSDAAISGYKSTVQGAKGTVGARELVNPKDILATEKAVTATAATMDTLNTQAIMVAAQGTFSQNAVAKAAKGSVEVQATVQGQMASLMDQFNNGTPAWAAGAMRAANAAMNARGLGGSSMAAAAIVQATMEAAIPIAAADAQTFAAMGMANLDNRQQVSLANAAAQQNLLLQNLSNTQQAALQNSTNAFALQDMSLSNTQAVVLANAQLKAGFQEKSLDIKTTLALTNAAKYAEKNNINLNNQQQALLQRSSENLQVEMSNLSNTQQNALANLQVRASILGQELSNEQQMAMLESTQAFEAANFDASAKQQAFLQDAQAKAALEGRAMDIRQQTQMFNISNIMEERGLEFNAEQQTMLFNTTSKMTIATQELSNKQQVFLANAQIEAALRGQELSNKQQTAVVNAGRFAEAANITFNAAETAKLSNSQLMQSIGLAEMSATNVAALQNAAKFADMDMTNLNNRQQAQVVNAQNFLQMDLANLDNEQQTTLFKTQTLTSTILSDTAAANAAKQFNAMSENQTTQFYDNLATQVSQFNNEQLNAMRKFNAGEKNTTAQFNAAQANARDQFNATNALVIAQANAVWQQTISTTENAAQNEANRAAALQANGMTQTTYDNMLQQERDAFDYAWRTADNAMARENALTIAEITGQADVDVARGQGTGQLLAKAAEWLFTKL
jgi:hypothetical protein